MCPQFINGNGGSQVACDRAGNEEGPTEGAQASFSPALSRAVNKRLV